MSNHGASKPRPPAPPPQPHKYDSDFAQRAQEATAAANGRKGR